MPSFDVVASHDPFFESCPCLKALLNIKILPQYLDEPNDQVKMEDPFENLKILSKKGKNPSTKNKTLLEVELHRVRISNKMMRMRNQPYA
jgi:hypothetical protein